MMDTHTQQSMTQFLQNLEAGNKSSHTATAYRTDLAQFFTYLSENDVTVTSYTQITRSHIIEHLSALARRGQSGVTRARKLASIREYFKFLVDAQLLSTSPASTIGTAERGPPF